MPRNRADELFDTQVDEARSRSRSPISAPGTSTLTDTEQSKFAGYIKEVAKDIPDEIRNKIQKAMQQYTRDTKVLLKFKEWLRSDQTDLDAIKSGRIPNNKHKPPLRPKAYSKGFFISANVGLCFAN
jgi:hypothetical protein